MRKWQDRNLNSVFSKDSYLVMLESDCLVFVVVLQRCLPYYLGLGKVLASEGPWFTDGDRDVSRSAKSSLVCILPARQI